MSATTNSAVSSNSNTTAHLLNDGALSSSNGNSHNDSDDDDDLNEAEEVRLMSHNQRFQAAVLRTMDKQLNRLESELRIPLPFLTSLLYCHFTAPPRHYLMTNDYTGEKAAVVTSSERAREDLALTLRDLRKQVGDINQSLLKRYSSYWCWC
jgi:hypothetical protein